jgi:DNA-binding response OmpR family regulator
LIVEDHKETAEMITQLLSMDGYYSVIAPDGKSGLEKAKSENPDLILLDVTLPGIDGLDVCSRLRADTATKDIPIVMVSLRSTEEDIRLGLLRGANAYVPKPFDPFNLLTVVKKYLGS